MKCFFLNKTYVFVLFVLSFSASAESIKTTSTVNSVHIYGTYNQSDVQYRNTVVFKTGETILACKDGFYISRDDSLLNPYLLSFVLSSFNDGYNLTISAYSDQLLLWHSGKVCRVNNLGLSK